jgi:predicted pyridoxine 5'-phosphate oxidase superfamily flavin-nucleotide-binding protein
MAMLTDEMKRVVGVQRLGYVATVCPDGTPNLSPRGTVAVWDDERFIFADIRSPNTVAHLHHNPAIEVSVVAPIACKGFRCKGKATVHADGPLFDEALAFFRGRGVANPIRHVVVIQVERALTLTSPGYDLSMTEKDVRDRWRRYYGALARGKTGVVTGE